MIRLWWWCIDRLSGMLEPAEREAVRGDLAESGAAAPRALGEVLGLVIRRQAALWKDWRPWIVYSFSWFRSDTYSVSMHL
jgi:hypothetical protein